MKSYRDGMVRISSREYRDLVRENASLLADSALVNRDLQQKNDELGYERAENARLCDELERVRKELDAEKSYSRLGWSELSKARKRIEELEAKQNRTETKEESTGKEE